MRSRALSLSAIAVALMAAGCGQASSAGDFEGAEARVAEVVEQLSSDGKQANAEEICSDLLTPELADAVAAGKLTCAAELDKALEDADSFDLTVEDVTITGDTAKATVEGADEGDGVTRTLEFAKDGTSWRISSFGAS